MGMAASQARLLCITARIHDVEQQAQSIQNAKLQLSTQSDQVYREYLEALDASTLTVRAIDPVTAKTSSVAATFNNLCSKDKLFISGNVNYAIHVDGLLLVEDNVEEKYNEALDEGINTPHDFAIFMIYNEKPSDPPSHTEPDPGDVELYNYYKQIFNQIKASKGCVSIADYGSDAANNSDWLKRMIETGVFSISIITEDDSADNDIDRIKFKRTAPNSDTNLSYITTTEVDNTALAKAEAKYENDLKKIDKKDKQFDLDLSKLETERTALTTEYESIKKVMNENIERSFGIFS